MIIMAKNRNFKAPLRRRKEGRTDYRQRLELLKSGKPRLVVRRFSNSFMCQVVAHESTGDKTLVTASAMDQKNSGWKAHGGNIPAAYLTGYICGKKALKAKVTEAVLDIGLHHSSKGSSIYAALKGAVDAGLNVPHSDKSMPPADRVSGKHIASYAAALKSKDPEKYKLLFSAYLKAGVEPEKLAEHFEQAKKSVKV